MPEGGAEARNVTSPLRSMSNPLMRTDSARTGGRIVSDTPIDPFARVTCARIEVASPSVIAVATSAARIVGRRPGHDVAMAASELCV
jgi:hypothetical protein